MALAFIVAVIFLSASQASSSSGYFVLKMWAGLPEGFVFVRQGGANIVLQW